MPGAYYKIVTEFRTDELRTLLMDEDVDLETVLDFKEFMNAFYRLVDSKYDKEMNDMYLTYRECFIERAQRVAREIVRITAELEEEALDAE